MAKRKLGASIVILCIAAITLISGTYAWFLVGGFANLFDIGFDVIESGAGIEIRGDRAGAEWKNELLREDFSDFSFIKEKGHYKPVSSVDGKKFVAVTMENHDFIAGGEGNPKSKTSEGVTAEDICYNDFTFYIRSTGDEQVDSGAYLTVELSGKDIDPETGKAVEPTGENADKVAKNKEGGASVAARVAVTIDGETKIYDTEGEATKAVTTNFADGTITDTITDAANNRGNQIIDSADPGYAAATLVDANPTKLTEEDGKTLIHINLGTIPAHSNSTGKEINIKIWLEGNDEDCVDQGERTIAGLNLTSQIKLMSAA